MPTHEIPTHLHVADRVVAGCTWSQLFTVSAAAAVAFWGWQSLSLPLAAHLCLCAMPMLAGLACAFWRPEGHGLLTWLGFATTYALTPRRMVWSDEVAHLLLPVPADVRVTTAGVADKLAVRRGTEQVSSRARHLMALAMGRGRSLPSPVATIRRIHVTKRVQPSYMARVHARPWTALLGYRLLCLSTHHMVPVSEEHHA